MPSIGFSVNYTPFGSTLEIHILMTPEAQRIAVAEACPRILNIGTDELGDEWLWQDYTETWRQCYSNDPLSDLHSMHEAEKGLTDEQHTQFRANLFGLIESNQKWQFVIIGPREYISATAAQRAEAFLRTLNLWDDTK